MTSNEPAGTHILGSLRTADGTGVVRIEDRYDTDINSLWSALAEPNCLARWYGQITGDLRPGGEFHGRLEYWEGTGRVEACDPSRRLLVTTKGADEPYHEHIEATLTADGNQTILVIETRGMPLELVAAIDTDADIQVHPGADPTGRDRLTVRIPLAGHVTQQWLRWYLKLAEEQQDPLPAWAEDEPDRSWIIVRMPSSTTRERLLPVLDAACDLISQADEAEQTPSPAEAFVREWWAARQGG